MGIHLGEEINVIVLLFDVCRVKWQQRFYYYGFLSKMHLSSLHINQKQTCLNMSRSTSDFTWKFLHSMSAAHFTQSAEFLARALAGVGLKQKLSLVILEEEDYRSLLHCFMPMLSPYQCSTTALKLVPAKLKATNTLWQITLMLFKTI